MQDGGGSGQYLSGEGLSATATHWVDGWVPLRAPSRTSNDVEKCFLLAMWEDKGSFWWQVFCCWNLAADALAAPPPLPSPPFPEISTLTIRS